MHKTYEGIYSNLLKLIFMRGALTIELSVLEEESHNVLEYIETSKSDTTKSNDVFYTLTQIRTKLKREIRRVKIKQKLIEISKKITQMIKDRKSVV